MTVYVLSCVLVMGSSQFGRRNRKYNSLLHPAGPLLLLSLSRAALPLEASCCVWAFDAWLCCHAPLTDPHLRAIVTSIRCCCSFLRCIRVDSARFEDPSPFSARSAMKHCRFVDITRLPVSSFPLEAELCRERCAWRCATRVYTALCYSL